MEVEAPPRAMGYVCIDLVDTLTGLNRQAVQVANRLGYDYIGLTRSSSLVIPEALLDHVQTHAIELLIVPNMRHLRGRIPAELAEMTDIHDMSTGETHERGGGYAPEQGRPNPLQPHPAPSPAAQ
ncbi:hypothetical protein [Nocardia veterana]|uniref:Uncharacterized protein n=1 Tax=Nocardia veterana TaxID=132249 RepID=A0A7X6M109_9NOCA|nr:hypothetical protein [Nocardia veterana]NKY88320.1 hypothetical protein [Nocardia veterana]